MANLYVDENFRYAVVELLRSLGHDVATVQEAGQQGGSDLQVLNFAIGTQRAVLTLNRRHFVRLHKQVQGHKGIIVCTDDDAQILAERIHHALLACPVLDDQLIRIDLPP